MTMELRAMLRDRDAEIARLRAEVDTAHHGIGLASLHLAGAVAGLSDNTPLVDLAKVVVATLSRERDEARAQLARAVAAEADLAAILNQHSKDCPTRRKHGEELTLVAIFACDCSRSRYRDRLEAIRDAARDVNSIVELLRNPTMWGLFSVVPDMQEFLRNLLAANDDLGEALDAAAPQRP